MHKGKLITVSYRLPYRFSIVRSKMTSSPGIGGLSTALGSYFENRDGGKNLFDSLHWVGVADLSRKTFLKYSDKEELTKDNITMHPIFLSQQVKEKYYNGFCNSVLWPLFLYFPSFVVYKIEFFEEYVNANKLFCEKIRDIFEPGDTIWVHDFHLMLLPTMLREILPEAKIGFFLHIPFPSFELYRLLPKPWRKELLSGLSGADVIGFQTNDFTEHFIDCVNDAFNVKSEPDGSFEINDRVTLMQSFPISIDYEKFSIESRTPWVRNNVRRIRERLGEVKIVLSVDRLDYSKAIFNRLEGFELFLEQNPGLREKVIYLLMMVPSRESILKYRENKLAIEALISRINAAYGTIGWTPVVYQYQSPELKKLVTYYGAADIALIVPSRDGMNLVAKEYVASRVDGAGVLILSETAGAARELKEAIIVNPNDRQEIADAILQAVIMPTEDQKFRMSRMQAHVRKNDVVAWASGFLHAMTHIPEDVNA
ncbi:MAG TPA: trehalose-6-phosphate synthase [Cyclobacteriaceae bacterium]|nr:trehalose-6-phosphate synthase [Cyclobacteriaceae bacterium]